MGVGSSTTSKKKRPIKKLALQPLNVDVFTEEYQQIGERGAAWRRFFSTCFFWGGFLVLGRRTRSSMGDRNLELLGFL